MERHASMRGLSRAKARSSVYGTWWPQLSQDQDKDDGLKEKSHRGGGVFFKNELLVRELAMVLEEERNNLGKMETLKGALDQAM